MRDLCTHYSHRLSQIEISFSRCLIQHRDNIDNSPVFVGLHSKVLYTTAEQKVKKPKTDYPTLSLSLQYIHVHHLMIIIITFLLPVQCGGRKTSPRAHNE